MIERIEETTVGAVVAADFRTADVFRQFGIDFCCGGRRSIGDACRSAAVEPDALVRALRAVGEAPAPEEDVSGWPADRLVGHIVSTHHAYVRGALPAIAHSLQKLEQVHGERHAELARVRASFEDVGAELGQHMMKEEQVLFPYILQLVAAAAAGRLVASPFGTIENPIRMMEREHRDAAHAMGLIRELTRDYTAPPDGCATYRAAMGELERFERDLHRHVHLENNVLFPMAIGLEAQLGGA